EVRRGLRMQQPDVAGKAVLRVIDDPLVRRHAEAHDGAAPDLRGKPLRMNHRARIRDADVIEDLEFARLDVELDLDEARRERRNRAGEREVVLRDADEPRAGDSGRRGLRHIVQIVRHLVAREPAAELDRALRGLGVREPRARIVLPEDTLVLDVVVVGRPAEIHRGDLFQLRDGVHRGRIVRAAHRERRVAAELPEVPRQVLRAVAALDDAVLPLALQRVRRDARGDRIRIRAEIADAGMDVELPVRLQHDETVEAARARGVIRLADADADNLGTIALPAARTFLRPTELGRADLERLL